MIQDVFGLVLRIAGVALIIAGYLDLFHVAVVLAGVTLPSRYSVPIDSLAAAEYGVPGLLLFFGADVVTRLAYRGRR